MIFKKYQHVRIKYSKHLPTWLKGLKDRTALVIGMNHSKLKLQVGNHEIVLPKSEVESI